MLTNKIFNASTLYASAHTNCLVCSADLLTAVSRPADYAQQSC